LILQPYILSIVVMYLISAAIVLSPTEWPSLDLMGDSKAPAHVSGELFSETSIITRSGGFGLNMPWLFPAGIAKMNARIKASAVFRARLLSPPRLFNNVS